MWNKTSGYLTLGQPTVYCGVGLSRRLINKKQFKMKKYIIGVFALVLLVSGSAFINSSQNEKIQDLKYWELVDLDNPQDPASYQEITDPGEYGAILCSGNQTVCKMQAVDDGNGSPVFDTDANGFPIEDDVNVKDLHFRNK